LFDVIWKLWSKYDYVFIGGLLGTLELSLVSVFFSTIAGAALAFVRLTKNRIANLIVDAYLSVLRGTPILLQLYFFWLLLPKIMPFEMTDTQSIVVALIINASSYVAEIIRAGIQAVDIGQSEAARSLGMSSINTLLRVVMPQAIRNILPALGNQYIMMVKETSLASVFYINDLMTAYKSVQSATFIAIPTLVIVGIIYFIVTTVLTKGLTIFERRLNRGERTA
jgi:His/Glu/Gln/Arg/opine family amino acid ABC transporter permease subunit